MNVKKANDLKTNPTVSKISKPVFNQIDTIACIKTSSEIELMFWCDTIFWSIKDESGDKLNFSIASH